MIRKPLFLFFILAPLLALHAQVVVTGDSLNLDYNKPREYSIGGVTVEGAPNLDQDYIKIISGLVPGKKIKVPGNDIAVAIQNLWKQGYFEDIQIYVTKVQGQNIFLAIQVKERPRLSKFSFVKGSVSKSEADDLREQIGLFRGKPVTDNSIQMARNTITAFFVEKGYPDVKVEFQPPVPDTTLANSVILYINIIKGPKVKIGKINIEGNSEFSDGKLRRKMKETKVKRWWDVFHSGKFLEGEFETDKEAILAKYLEKGYRDAKIVKDSIYRISPTRMGIDIRIEEGKKYYFRNITWVGNAKYASKDLSRVLAIKKGDVYNQAVLESRLYMNPNGTDVSSLYMDDGYLFFSVTPVEVKVENDSIDLEIRIVEGKQATINKVTVTGNTKTNDKVILRELHTHPGQLFRRSDIIRSQRELAQLGYFDPEKMDVKPTPDAVNGTVDIEYVVEEKPSDQIELSGGFGAGRVVGTLGVSFNNFSLANALKGDWHPIPTGDGQRISLRAQSTGLYYQSYNFSFTEPWLGGKKPNSLSFTGYYSRQTNGLKRNTPGIRSIDIWGLSTGFGKRMKKPDDYFQFYGELNYQYYVLENFTSFIFSDGYSNNLFGRMVISRSSIDFPLYDYPTSGSQFSFSAQATLPYSGRLLRGVFYDSFNYSDMTDQQKYKWVEYYKLKFTASWFTKVAGKDRKHALVLNTRMGWGFLGFYNKDIGLAPFERFYLGGSGLTGFALDGREIIALRGYDDGILSPSTGASAIAKYTLELRYPLSLNPSAMIYCLAFAEAGNSWDSFRHFNPFSMKRSAGVGVRIFLPMFGMLGLDYGWRLDDAPRNPFMQKSQFHFTIGMNLGEL
ncbi:MAG: outer membrane protein assembly factor BamA [Bacteroidota bacterium]